MTTSNRRLVRPYGPDERQVVEWFLPKQTIGAPWIAIVHGGFWRPKYSRHLEDDIANDLANQGFAVSNIEYRDYDQPWPSIYDDVARAIDMSVKQAHRYQLHTAASAILGHSAGGALALWAVSGGVAHAFCVAIASAPVACLSLASSANLGHGAVDHMMGGSPADVVDRYARCDPSLLIPNPNTDIVLLHGDADVDVPLEQSQGYVDVLAAKGVATQLFIMPGDDHYAVLNPSSLASQKRLAILKDRLNPGA
ncbi:MAG: prolyl oligopeptidase family serine peptidase [Candidatus Nanopelagicales bacterium]